jgi:hypothetical protein
LDNREIHFCGRVALLRIVDALWFVSLLLLKAIGQSALIGSMACSG